jgi:ATP-binding cassette, subfamily C, bacterial
VGHDSHGIDSVSLREDATGLYALAEPKGVETLVLSGLTIIEVALSLPGPFLFAGLLDRALNVLQVRDLVVFAISMLALELASMGMRIWRVRLNRVLSLNTANRLRDRFFTHLLHLPYSWYLQHRSGGQASSYLSDIDDIDRAVTGLVDRGLRSVLMMGFLALSFIFWNPLLASVALVTIPLTVLCQRKLRHRVRKSSRERVDCRENMVSTVSEAVTHYQAVKAYVLEDYIEAQVSNLSQRYANISTALETRQAALRSTSSVMLLGVQYGFFVLGACLVISGGLALSAFLGQMVLLGRLVAPMNTLMDYGNELSRCRGALSRVQSTLALVREDSGDDARQALVPQQTGGLSVWAQQLEFRFDERLPLMQGWNFDIKAGQSVALVGPSGSGKTTLLNLLLGLFTGYEGSLRIDGIERRELSHASVRKRVGVVFQEQQMFNASVRDNLALACDGIPTDGELWEALRLAHAEDFVRAFPQQLETILGVDGIQCSGGQRQRLAIAQTLLSNPALLLLDEATSALDSFSEAHIQAALKELMHSRTSIVVAHRLSTVREADKILVVDGGQIVEQGHHEQLLNQNGIYARLCRAQQQGFLDWDQVKGTTS